MFGKTDPIWVVVQCEPATQEYDAEYTVLDVNGGRPGGIVEKQGLFGPEKIDTISDADWGKEFFDTCTTSETMLSDIFGKDIPDEVKSAKKFIVRGRIITERFGGFGEAEEWDSYFETESWRVLT